ncbi:MAG TPA: hypothetical protein DCS93_26745 [Microscillaceae bacterium]|nr:hypothetical protein [Microscillaceae bacterium]
MEKLFEHSQVDLYWNKTENYLRLDWRDRVELEVYKNALLKSLEVVEQHQVVRFLIDQRVLEYVGSEAQAWLSVKWFPALEQLVSENVYMAILPSKSLFVRLASQTVSQRLKNTTFYSITKYFDNEALALDWLLSEQPTH